MIENEPEKGGRDQLDGFATPPVRPRHEVASEAEYVTSTDSPEEIDAGVAVRDMTGKGELPPPSGLPLPPG